MRISRVLLVKGDSQYDALDYFIDSLGQAFQELEIEVDVFDTSKEDEVVLWNVNQEYDMIFSFNGMWSAKKNDYFMQNRSTFVWDFYVDHPIYHDQRLLRRNFRQIASFVDRKHAKYVENYYGSNYKTYFIPHGGIVQESIKNWATREYEISFIGTYENPDDYLNEIGKYDSFTQDVIYDLIDLLWFNPKVSFEEVFEYEIKQKNLRVAKDEFARLLVEWKFIDRFVRAKKRQDLIKTLLEAGRVINVFGKGWEGFESENMEKLIIHPSCNFEESLRIMANSKIVLNTMPFFAAGSHERVFNILGAGAICITDSSEYLEEEFVHGQHLFFYSHLNMDEVHTIIVNVLDNENQTLQIIRNGYALIEQKHTWKERAKQMICELRNLPEWEVDMETTLSKEMAQLIEYKRNVPFEIVVARSKGRYLYTQIKKEKYSLADVRCKYALLEEMIGKVFQMDILEVWRRFEDTKSKSILTAWIKYWLNGDIWELRRLADSSALFGVDEDIVKLSQEENIVEYGRSQGSVLGNIIREVSNHFEKLVTFSNGEEALVDQNRFLKYYPQALTYNAWDKQHTKLKKIDEYVKVDISYLKIDLVKFGINILKSAEMQIRKNHPIVVLNVQYDVDQIPLAINMLSEWNKNYKFYLRYYGNSEADPEKLIMYAV